VDETMIGRAGKPFEMVIEAGKVREFARATRAELEVYRGRCPPSPPSFLVTASLWMESENWAWGDEPPALGSALHGAEEFVFLAPPPPVGSRLRGVNRIDKVYEKEGRRGGRMTFTEMVTDFHDAAGTLVAQVRKTMIETSRPVHTP
jgi:hypothetical protein